MFRSIHSSLSQNIKPCISCVHNTDSSLSQNIKSCTFCVQNTAYFGRINISFRFHVLSLYLLSPKSAIAAIAALSSIKMNRLGCTPLHLQQSEHSKDRVSNEVRPPLKGWLPCQTLMKSQKMKSLKSLRQIEQIVHGKVLIQEDVENATAASCWT